MKRTLSPRPSKGRARKLRGQSLVLWCMALFLLSLMAVGTIGLAMRARDRVEIQTAADAAAYTEAVLTARALNGMAVMNRTHLSHMVALSAVQSLVSWSGEVKGAVPAMQAALNGLASQVGRGGQPNPGPPGPSGPPVLVASNGPPSSSNPNLQFGSASVTLNGPGSAGVRNSGGFANMSATGGTGTASINTRPGGCSTNVTLTNNSSAGGTQIANSGCNATGAPSAGTAAVSNPPAGGGSCTGADTSRIVAAASILGRNAQAFFGQPWQDRDQLAGQEAQSVQFVAASQAQVTQQLRDELVGALTGQNLARQMVKVANPELQAPETGVDPARSVQSALFNVDSRSNPQDSRTALVGAIQAAMGERGDSFTSNRSGGRPIPITGNLTQGLDPNIHLFLQGKGGSGFGPNAVDAQMHGQVDPTAAWSEDEAVVVTATYQNPGTGCFALFAAPANPASLRSDPYGVPSDQHTYSGGQDLIPPKERHTLGPEPGQPLTYNEVWPYFVDYNPKGLGAPDGLNGQPVLNALLHRDFSARHADPWNLSFRFLFTQAGAGFDNASPQGLMANQPALKDQVALSTAIAYYHRPGAFQEPPNLFNPFWRATLISLQRTSPDRTVWSAAAADALRNAGFASHADTLQALVNQGFRGMP